MEYLLLSVTSQRAFLVEIHFSSGNRSVLSIDDSEADCSADAVAVARDRYERVVHQPEKYNAIDSRISFFGEPVSFSVYRDTEQQRDKLGLGAQRTAYVAGARPGWYDTPMADLATALKSYNAA